MKAPLYLGVALAVSAPALAVELPQPGHDDARVRTVVYQPMNVVTVDAAQLRSTMIEFAPTETIGPISVGDPEAWSVQPAGNYLFVKPKVSPGRETNVQLVTKRQDGTTRVYQFDLVPHDDASAPGVFYAVVFQYPADVAAEKKAQAVARWKVQQTKIAKDRLDTDWFAGKRNWEYVARGSVSLCSPSSLEVSDNGELTAFRFPGRTSLPAIYRVRPDKTEEIANFTMRDDNAVVHGISGMWRLRDGKEVCDIRNMGYDPKGYDPGTGTTSPEVVRTTVARSE